MKSLEIILLSFVRKNMNAINTRLSTHSKPACSATGRFKILHSKLILSSKILFFLGFVIVLFQSCQQDEPLTALPIIEEEKTFTNIPEPLWDYFERFENAALERGWLIGLNDLNLTAEIVEITEDGVAGTCSYGSHTPKHIEIDATFWNQSSDLFKEFVVFHELGHCVLFRGHREDAHQDGTCVSLMRSGVEECRDNYRLSTRENYLDELFEGLSL